MKKVKATALITVLIILLNLLLSACSAPAGEQSPSPDVSSGYEPTYVFKPDPTSGDTLIMTVNSTPVYYSEFKYWMFSSLVYYADVYGLDPAGTIDWSFEYQGMPLSEFIIKDAMEAIKLYRTIEAKCAEFGVVLSEEDIERANSLRDENIAYFGGEDAYNAYLTENALTEELMRYMFTVSCLYRNLYIEVYGENGEKCPDDEVRAFGDAYGYIRAKHILISHTDLLNNRLSDEEIAENYAALEAMLAELDASDDSVMLFDELMREHSEDPGALSYPDGYQFLSNAGIMVQNFEAAILAMPENGYSGIIDIDYGYSIIMRLPLIPDLVPMSESNSLRYNASIYQFESLSGTWSAEAEVVFEEAYNGIRPEDIF